MFNVGDHVCLGSDCGNGVDAFLDRYGMRLQTNAVFVVDAYYPTIFRVQVWPIQWDYPGSREHLYMPPALIFWETVFQLSTNSTRITGGFMDNRLTLDGVNFRTRYADNSTPRVGDMVYLAPGIEPPHEVLYHGVTYPVVSVLGSGIIQIIEPQIGFDDVICSIWYPGSFLPVRSTTVSRRLTVRSRDV